MYVTNSGLEVVFSEIQFVNVKVEDSESEKILYNIKNLRRKEQKKKRQKHEKDNMLVYIL